MNSSRTFLTVITVLLLQFSDCALAKEKKNDYGYPLTFTVNNVQPDTRLRIRFQGGHLLGKEYFFPTSTLAPEVIQCSDDTLELRMPGISESPLWSSKMSSEESSWLK